MNKPRKIALIISASLASAIVTYFAGGLIVTSIVSNGFINKRYSDVSTLGDDFYRVQKVRTDYESLSVREEISFTSGEETLMGYLYESASPKGVIIMAHGVNNQADGNSAPMQDYYVNHNYDVFAIDLTGCGRSTGKGIKTLHESRYCVANAVKTVKNLAKTKDLPIFLIGHSWGAYGAVAATQDVDGVKAVASFSGYNKPNDMMFGFAESYTTRASVVLKPSLDFSLSVLCGGDSFFSAEKAIRNNSDVHYVVIHGEKDNTVPLKKYSLYDNIAKDGYSNVTPILLNGVTHGAPWKTVDAMEYTSEVEKGLADLRKKYKGKLPDDVREEYLSSFDKERTSVVNTDLLNQIDTIFTSYI